ncbi:alanine racemase [uncultured Bradyrhizobium sp.]|uniref:alanine racemase n=1 Tax=uncultured Bradyrhizobium sp. TaxID=199684 RepID=UPI0035C98360
MTVNLQNLRHNWQLFRRTCGAAEVTGVVKANGYGCGLIPVARALVAEGCRTFFVAHLHEGIALRKMNPSISIYALHAMPSGAAGVYRQHRILPVLTSMAQIKEWADAADDTTMEKAAIHVCTGMNRSGIPATEIGDIKAAVAAAPARFGLLLSHFACADESVGWRNDAQLAVFRKVRQEFPALRATLANTSGCLRLPDAHFDMVRPGIGLYGGNPFPSRSNPFRPVVALRAPVIEIRRARAGAYVGYGNDFCLKADTTLALLSIGYADGLPRQLSSGAAKAVSFFYDGHPLPVTGRVSMDLTVVTVPDRLTDALHINDPVEIIGPHQSLDDLAGHLGTIPNEVITSFGNRVDRVYCTQHAALPRTAGAGRCAPLGLTSINSVTGFGRAGKTGKREGAGT